jgi:predicted AlkP superfamily pyrophosphatase or phosphodiesterase
MKLLLSLLIVLFSSVLMAAPKGEKPKLVVSIVIDQFRYDYLDRFAKFYLPAAKKSGGFKRLIKNGALFTNANYTYGNTYTGPGHETSLSGVNLSRSGIIANDWYSRVLGRTVYCAEDTDVVAVGTDSARGEGKRSPRNAMVENFCDRLKSSSPESKVIGIAIKDRGAILPAGKKATGAFWFDAESGQWISSSYYFPSRELPAWMTAFNLRQLPESYMGKTWERLLPERSYPMTDNGKGEATLIGETEPIFPHKLFDIRPVRDNPLFKRNRVYEPIAFTPYGSEMTIACAQAAIEGEALGQRVGTDILAVSFSTVDYCGHTFGPDSQEQMDIIIRLDRQLSEFFQFLDLKVGFDNYVVVLTADHGVCPMPDQVADGYRVNEMLFLDSLKKLVYPVYPNVIKYFINEQVYINYDTVAARGYQMAEVEKEIGKNALMLRGIGNYYTRSEMRRGKEYLDPLGVMTANAFYPALSGDVLLVVKPYTIFSSRQTGTTHGTPHNYDTHVPVLFSGGGIKRGNHSEPVGVIDIAPTLHRLLGLGEEQGMYDGKVLEEILK